MSTNEREELAERVKAEIAHNISPVIGWLRLDASKGRADHDGKRLEAYEDRLQKAAEAVADILRKPRTITTVEELDALPVGAAVIHDEGWGHTIAERHVSDGLWYVTGCLEYIRSEALLPATVLHEPEPQP